ncbi:MAG TPA: carboxypeptidase regulatory-like domain-containing protein [Candidatus Sulfotelmatobacter sp.]|nr:carboxypeptidase regulatory-like domain-containing protein [Candidatus Sulfotelmatobacter sp.]
MKSDVTRRNAPAFRVSCLFFLSILAIAALALAPIIAAQSTGGRIRGTVSDPSGAAVVGAKVTLINEATNVSRDVDTGSNGDYLLIEVPVGSYEIDVTQQGFKKYVRKGIALNLNEVISVDIALQLGATAETVEVTGAPPVVDTTSTQLGAVVNERASTQLPLNQRDVYQLLQLQPGVQSQLGNDLFYGSDKAGVVTVNGGRGRSNNYSVNGGDGNDLFANLPAIEPSPDSIEEFRVISNSFDAEYGRNSGAVVNVVTKSGTNAIHGSFYEFFRNDVLNAHPFTFFPAPKPEFRQNQFGGTIGGPIRKDKTFFFGSYEGRRIVQGILSQPISVPTSAELTNGDFSAPGLANGVLDPSGTPGFAGSLTDATVANILSTRCGSSLGAPAAAAVASVAGGGPSVPYSTIFPNFHIPTACFDPVAVSLLQYVPGAGGTGGVQVTPNKTDRGDQFQIRVDHSINNNQKLAIYYYFDDDNTLDPFAKFQASGATTGNFPGVYATRTQQINASHTWTIGSTSVNEARVSYFREGQLKFDTPTRTGSIQSSCGAGAAAAFCFTGASDTPLFDDSGAALGTNADYGIHSGLGASKEGVPFIDVGGGFTIGNNFNGQLPQTGNTYQFSDNFSKIIGSHSLKFGGDVRYQMFDQLLYFDVNGDMEFLSSPNGPVGNDLGFSDAYPDYLLGIANSYFQGSAQHELVRSTSLYLFAQDSWKIKPNVTLNYGLRWEMNTPLTDIGKKVQTFRPGETSTIYPCTLPTTNPLFVPGSVENCDQAGVTPVGLVFPGDKGVPSALTNTYYKGFAPRLGLAWSPGWKDGLLGKLAGGPGKTSVSMGYGIFYNPIEQLVLEQFSAEPPFGGSNFISSPLLQTPYVDQSGDVFPNPFNGILNPPRGQPIDWSQFRPMTFFGEFPPNLRMQYSDQYNLTIKRQLPGEILFQIGYVGSQGHRLLASYEINPGNPTTCNQLNTILGAGTCGPFGEDSSYTIPAGTVIPAGGFQLPYNAGSGGLTVPAGVLANPITLVGIRQYSSPLCQPLTGVGCPADGNPVFSGIFTENTVAKSNYNSLQALIQKNLNHGLQFQASYTFSKTMDNASSFESALNPLNFDATYGLSAYDARHRFVFNYVWDLPVPKFDGFKGKLLDGWELSGILTFQSGFPVRITSQDDIEELDSTDLFEFPGEPNLTAPFHTQNIRQNNGFDFNPSLFTNATVAPGTIGNAPRSICCGPGINNWDMSFMKETRFGERWNMEFRGDVFNIWNHAQFYSVDGDVSNTGSTFGQVQHVRDPRLVQFSLKFRF